MRRPMVAGNWKMNGARDTIRPLLEGLARIDIAHTDCVVFPPAVYTAWVAEQLAATALGVGAQNVDPRQQGAVTGEIAADMLTDVGCGYCLVGHSERRTLFGETDDDVAAKYLACLQAGLCPVLCIGETLLERQSGESIEVVLQQLQAVIEAAGAAGMARGIVAYEPVWAIGTGESATPEQAQEVHAAVRAHLVELDRVTGENVRILYGGSVNAANAQALFANEDIDGALVGGASLKIDEFATIVAMAGQAGS